MEGCWRNVWKSRCGLHWGLHWLHWKTLRYHSKDEARRRTILKKITKLMSWIWIHQQRVGESWFSIKVYRCYQTLTFISSIYVHIVMAGCEHYKLMELNTPVTLIAGLAIRIRNGLYSLLFVNVRLMFFKCSFYVLLSSAKSVRDGRYSLSSSECFEHPAHLELNLK